MYTTKRFLNVNDAFEYAENLAKSNEYVIVIQSIDNVNTPQAEVAFYVETKPSMIRFYEKEEYIWENGKLTNVL